MIITTMAEAITIAIEMEKRSIRIYERVMMLESSAKARNAAAALLKDEKRHLARFTQLSQKCEDNETLRYRQLLKSIAGEILFPGGVMEMSREDSFSSPQALYRYAAEAEETAVSRYQHLADTCPDAETAEAFRMIAAEEQQHLCEMNAHMAETGENDAAK